MLDVHLVDLPRNVTLKIATIEPSQKDSYLELHLQTKSTNPTKIISFSFFRFRTKFAFSLSFGNKLGENCIEANFFSIKY